MASLSFGLPINYHDTLTACGWGFITHIPVETQAKLSPIPRLCVFVCMRARVYLLACWCVSVCVLACVCVCVWCHTGNIGYLVMIFKRRTLINWPWVYFSLLMTSVANHSLFNAFHLVLLMSAFHKTWQLFRRLFLDGIYHSHILSYPTLFPTSSTAFEFTDICTAGFLYTIECDLAKKCHV